MAALTVSPTQIEIQIVLRSFLLSILPSGVEVVEGNDNDVAEPSGSAFVIMTTLRRERLATNIGALMDTTFIGVIADTVLTVSEMETGAIYVGDQIFGVSLARPTTITSENEDGTYVVSPGQTIASQPMSAGKQLITQKTKVTIQLDFHSADVSTSADMAQVVSTLLRDPYAIEQFKASGYDVTPLYADDPRQMAFSNTENQFETRYLVEAVFQVNQTVIVPQEFMSTAVPAVTRVS